MKPLSPYSALKVNNCVQVVRTAQQVKLILLLGPWCDGLLLYTLGNVMGKC